MSGVRKRGNKDGKQLGGALREPKRLLLFGAGRCLGASAGRWREGGQKGGPRANGEAGLAAFRFHSNPPGDLAVSFPTGELDDGRVRVHK